MSETSSQLNDQGYCGLPWKAGGRVRTGLDCAGLAHLWLVEQCGFSAPSPSSNPLTDSELSNLQFVRSEEWKRGDIVFFRHRERKLICHVAVFLGANRFLHIIQGCQSRIDNGLTLLSRLKLDAIGALPPTEVETLCAALSVPGIGDASTWIAVIGLVVSAALTGISYALAPSLSQHQPRHGQYSQDALFTQKNPEIALPDILGTVVVAGNAIFEELPDRGAAASPAGQKWDQIVVLGSGPVNLIDYQTGLKIKGISWQDKSFYNGNKIDGLYPNPVQDKDNAVTGSILTDSNVPSISFYDGAHDITVPVDIRASYDRDFPIYGLSGCAYFVLRAIDSAKFGSLNFTTRVAGRLVRQFNSSGFTRTGRVDSFTGDGSTVRFKLAAGDIESVSGVNVGATNYTEISASNQSGNIYQLNRTKGFIEFITAPAAAASIGVTYYSYDRAFSSNPADHVVYLLTEPVRGKGLAPDRIDWAAAVDFHDYCDASLTYSGPNGTVTTPRWQTNYAVDDRKPLQDHIQALLDACNGQLILSNGKFIITPRAGTTSVFSFNPANILLDDQGNTTFKATLVDRAGKPNRVHVLFSSEQSLNAEDEAIADDVINQDSRASRVGNNGIVDENLKFPAVTDPNQAQRIAELTLAESVNSNWAFEWRTNIQGLALQPGDLVDITHPALPGLAKQVRIETLEYDENDNLKLTTSEYVPQAYL